MALARALMMEPAVLLADEPTAALDPARAAEVKQLLMDEAARLGPPLSSSPTTVRTRRAPTARSGWVERRLSWRDMPRISAATIAEHVAQQEAAVIDAARRLFDTRGFQHVSMRDIADEVGLSRTALYRYFPTKAHLVQGWFDAAMTPLIAASEEAVAEPGSAAARLDRWLAVQLDFLLDDEHTALVSAALESEDLPAEVRDHIGARHRELYSSLTRCGCPAGSDPTVLRVRTMLIAGQVRTAADLDGTAWTGHTYALSCLAAHAPSPSCAGSPAARPATCPSTRPGSVP